MSNTGRMYQNYVENTQVVRAEYKGGGWLGNEFKITIRNCQENGREHVLYNDQPSYKRLIAMVNRAPWRVEITEDGWEARWTRPADTSDLPY